MEASEMIDVLHYFFEEDMNYATGQQLQAHTKLRTLIYKDLYGIEYQYGTNAVNSSSSYGPSMDGDYETASGTKPYIPPTEFNPDSPLPFGTALEAPIG